MLSWEKLIDNHRTDALFADHSDDQIEVIIKVLAHAVYADNRASFMEKIELERMFHKLPWAKDKQALIDRITQEASETAKGEREGAFRAVAEAAAARLDVAERETIFLMAVVLAWAEGEVHSKEHQTLQSLAQAFGISAEQADAWIKEGGEDEDED